MFSGVGGSCQLADGAVRRILNSVDSGEIVVHKVIASIAAKASDSTATRCLSSVGCTWVFPITGREM